ncbi:DUF5996 family protein [Herbiconiux moechotypicola]|uniref:DUF5996 family protein n=1 Tax=Herbiconiux moechotypicola TaxID=637393 RepID=A0ABN3DHL5_9MICO|nr:DUF5996 family protein [Herbiconiux moechotypicola]MCS5729639.1 DUF5996 family protein [Herbiconiux moechotypicola]
MTASWPILPVDSWTPTRETLHLFTQIVGKIRLVASPPVNHWWHVTLYVTSRGLSTGAVPVDGGLLDIEFDFVGHRLVLRTSWGGKEAFALAGLSVASFYDQVFSALRRLGVSVSIRPVPNEVEVAIPFPDDTQHASYDPEAVHAFYRQLVLADGLLRRFRSEFTGKASPVHYFWGAMDLAVTRFSGRPAPLHPGGAPNCPDSVMHEGYSHELSSAGFWPGGGAEGAFYSYAYPAPEGYADAAVPDGSFFSEAYGEFLLPVETVRVADDPDVLVLDFLRATTAAAEGLAEWPRA